jgi:hypothetical protein
VIAARIYVACACLATAAAGQSSLEQLQAAEQPHFRDGHTLPPLTRWGWSMPFDVRVELAENWGYALEFGGYATEEAVAALADPDSTESKICALTAADPERYPLCVLTIHSFGDDAPDEAWCRDADGELIDGRKTWSPEAPDSIFEEAGKRWAEPLKAIIEKAPIAMVLNGGEYALSVYGHHGEYWEQDPAVMAARGDKSWYDYVSEQKGRQESTMADALRQAVPGRQLYIYYYADGCPHRNRYADWWRWAWDYRWMRPVSDLPSSSIYYVHFNTGWTGDSDMLTQALNGVAQHIELGDSLSYNWMCAGWVREDLGQEAFSEPDRYVGFLKCYYTAGMIGAVAGYFSYPSEDDPNWLWQMTALGRMHALFSHLEDFLRDGDLLPGPDPHRWSTDLPAYELPTGDPDARVLARKHRERDEWLITAWAAGGDDRDVSVDVPELGEVTLRARSCGSVYRATRQDNEPSLTLVDLDGIQPTAHMDD